MSEILSYSNNTSKNGEEDWIAHAPYSDDDIARIKDPDGGLSENPRTAIPSPLAQQDLVKNAFKQLANEHLRGLTCSCAATRSITSTCLRTGTS